MLFSAFYCFLVLVKSYRKKKKFKTGLITLYIPILSDRKMSTVAENIKESSQIIRNRNFKESQFFTKDGSRSATTNNISLTDHFSWYICFICHFWSTTFFLFLSGCSYNSRKTWLIIQVSLFSAKRNIKFTGERNIIVTDHTESGIFLMHFLRRSSFIFHPKRNTIFLENINASFPIMQESLYFKNIFFRTIAK